MDRNEVTDKGSINQRATLATAPRLVEELYARRAGRVIPAGSGRDASGRDAPLDEASATRAS